LHRLQSLLGPDIVRLLNVERRIARASDWRSPDAAPLWTYHLHYFDDLNACDAQARVTWHENLLARWAAENPPGQGEGWDPYPVSRRIVNCVKWVSRGNSLPAPIHASLAVQTRWLDERLEYHILGNHLFANAKAYISTAPSPSAGTRVAWRSTSELELTMYHAGILEDLLDLVNLLSAYGASRRAIGLRPSRACARGSR
jgi:hypothetical protein